MRRLLVPILAVAALARGTALADVVYDSIPSPTAINYPSLGYQATSTSEFGDAVALAGTARALTSATVLLSNWALESTYETVGTSAGFNVPMTLNIYALGSGGLNPVPGSLIASSTINAFIQWRPEADPGCSSTNPTGFDPPACFNGLAQPVSFNFNGESLPDSVIFGLTFNTQSYGPNPIGAPGPYNSLNFAVPADGATVGTDINPDGVEWNTSHAGFLDPGGPGQAGVFGPDTNWTGNVPAVELDAIPEPASLLVLGTAVLGIAGVRRRRA
jgi:PEP-CTERM motif